jgi:hypothetical protein
LALNQFCQIQKLMLQKSFLMRSSFGLKISDKIRLNFFIFLTFSNFLPSLISHLVIDFSNPINKHLEKYKIHLNDLSTITSAGAFK